jgi:spore coat protein U-like protein
MKRRGLFVAVLLTGLAFVIAPAPARAASCSFVSVTGVSFGTYDVFASGSTDSAGSLSYSCSGGATVTIALSLGNAPSYDPRLLLKLGGATIDYNLYLDAARNTIWGDGVGLTGLYGPIAPADGVTVTVPIFGRIPAGQDASVGAYTDTITATINY